MDPRADRIVGRVHAHGIRAVVPVVGLVHTRTLEAIPLEAEEHAHPRRLLGLETESEAEAVVEISVLDRDRVAHVEEGPHVRHEAFWPRGPSRRNDGEGKRDREHDGRSADQSESRHGGPPSRGCGERSTYPTRSNPAEFHSPAPGDTRIRRPE